MENFKRSLKLRVVWGSVYCAAALVLSISLPFAAGRTYASGFTVGVAIGIAAIALFFVIQSARALKNEEKIRKLYIAQTDERAQFIAGRCARSSLLIILALIALADLVAVYLDRTVFYTLLTVTYCIALIAAGSKLYYRKKL